MRAALRTLRELDRRLRPPLTGLALVATVVVLARTGPGLDGREVLLLLGATGLLWAVYLPLEFALVALVAAAVGCAWEAACFEFAGGGAPGRVWGAALVAPVGVLAAALVLADRLERFRGSSALVPRAFAATAILAGLLLLALTPLPARVLAAPGAAALLSAALGADILLFKQGQRGTPALLHLCGGLLIFAYLGVAQSVLFALVTPLAFIATRRRLALVRVLCSRGMRLMFDAFPYGRLERRGVGAQDLRRPAVIVSNHQSSVDIPLVLSLPADIRILVSPRVWRTPILGIGARLLSHVLVDSERPEVTLERCRERLRQGASVHAFPEGTRSEGGYPGRFHRGAFEIACELGADVLPLLLVNSRSCVPRDAFWVGSFRISVEALPRVTPHTFDYGLGSRALMKHVQALVRGALVSAHRRLHCDPVYLARLVRDDYRFQARRVRRDVLRELAEWERLATWRPLLADLARVLVVESGFGVGSRLCSLPELRTSCTGWLRDEAHLRVAQRSAIGPGLLEFAVGACPPVEPSQLSALVLGPGIELGRHAELVAGLSTGCLVLSAGDALPATLRRLGLEALAPTPGAYRRAGSAVAGARA
jgi:1-acyl-sn-glycerol-3-phosphate acyltransferase